MPKPQWGWFAVAIAAFVVGVGLVLAGWAVNPATGGFQGFVVGGIALLAGFAFGKAFFDFNYRRPGE